MNDLLLKYDQLDAVSKKEVQDFINFLLAKRQRKMSKKPTASYRDRILSVSVWSDEDIQIFDKNRTLFNQWQPKEW
jgi:hypothetical protein